jgi:hypothetical protein
MHAGQTRMREEIRVTLKMPLVRDTLSSCIYNVRPTCRKLSDVDLKLDLYVIP